MQIPIPPKPPQTELHEKLAHLTTEERARVLKMLAKVAPKHNRDVMESKAKPFQLD